MSTRGGFIDLTIGDVFELPKETFNFTIKPKDLFEGKSEVDKEGRTQLWCPVDPFPAVEIPAEWYDKVHMFGGGQTVGFTGGGGMWQRAPEVFAGFIYVMGQEYNVQGPVIKPTGAKLLPAPPEKKA